MGRQPCCDKVGVKKGPWTAEEDQKLVGFLLTHGHCCWRVVPKLAGLLRCGKSCRLRWTNYLRPDLKRGLLSDDEEQLVIDLHAQLGNRWSKIAARLPGRTDNEIKNHWNTHIRKKLLRMGIDPVTHLPLHNEPLAPAPPQDQPDHPPPLKEQEPQNDAARHHHGGANRSGGGEQLRLRLLRLRRLRVRGLAVLLLLGLGLGPGGVRRGGDGVAGAHVPVRHGRHHGRRLGRPLPRRRRRHGRRPVRRLPVRRLRSRRRLDVTTRVILASNAHRFVGRRASASSSSELA
ncbi:hypothetical protein HU200_021637 [Digitaria exilis]|uniref:Uncharacterized protein n=1 Tax=Digitaria exilis TaxID=1010633 RepID=A0A835EZG7_9POAL|nr:hypothetical protein HU200_021637 [Digitaria exilis]